MARRANSADPRAQRTRAALLEASLHLVRQKRVENITIAEIAREAAVSRQGFYEHFDDRDDAVAAAINELASVRLAALTTSEAPGRTVADALESLVDYLLEERVLYEHLHLGPIQDRAMSSAREALWPASLAMADRALRRRRGTADADDVEELARFVNGGLFESIRSCVRDGLSRDATLARMRRLNQSLEALVGPIT